MSVKVEINPSIQNEYDRLKEVVVGTAESFGGIPVDPYDPKSKEHINNGTFPIESDLKSELDEFVKVLEKHNVNVFRPTTISNLNQIFARDIAFVVGDKLVISNMISDRADEIKALENILSCIDNKNVISAPDEVRFEGGDVMPHNDMVFVGYEEEEDFKKYKVSRTNKAGVEFIKSMVPDKKVIAFELNKSDTDPKENALHLDCCFQPLGLGHCIIHKEGFKNESDYDYLRELFGVDNCIDISKDEMYNMGSNVFSIDKDVVVSEKGQTRINSLLKKFGYTVEEVSFSETSKMEGLFRCTTLPLVRL